MKELNPSNRQPAERTRIPMSTPVQKLEVAEIPGFHLHWFRGEPDRLERARNAGYEFVDEQEIRVTSVGLGSDPASSGNTDMGSRVSIVGGGVDDRNQPVRLYLMKIKQEFWEQDQKQLEARNDAVAASLMSGTLGQGNAADKGEQGLRYVRKDQKVPELFRKGAMARRTAGQRPTT